MGACFLIDVYGTVRIPLLQRYQTRGLYIPAPTPLASMSTKTGHCANCAHHDGVLLAPTESSNGSSATLWRTGYPTWHFSVSTTAVRRESKANGPCLTHSQASRSPPTSKVTDRYRFAAVEPAQSSCGNQYSLFLFSTLTEFEGHLRLWLTTEPGAFTVRAWRLPWRPSLLNPETSLAPACRSTNETLSISARCSNIGGTIAPSLQCLRLKKSLARARSPASSGYSAA